MRGVVIVCGLALAAAGRAEAIDYDKVERRLVKEPAYKTKNPQYALLVFGPEARLRVWVVLDGEALYIDRNGDGDLTAEHNRFAKEADCKSIELRDPDGKTRYVIDRVQTDYSFYTPKVRDERKKKGTPPGLMAYVSIKGGVEYQQYCDIVELSDSPKTAMLAHFHGPLTIAPMTINWKLPESAFLRKGKGPPEFIANVGTLSEKHGCWVVVRTCDEKACLFPDGVRPVVEVEYPAAVGTDPPVKKTYTLNGYRCGAAFRGNLSVPDGVGSGKAKVRLSFDSWKEGRVSPSEVDLPVREAEAGGTERK
ncbi:hypothetical protein [Frigoriglobus tundricola]|uniref:Uncharacterized protein n=1 Tax=Frigoriglobus tundricola TaxID=2774151 RepID=A0A6M5YZK2_9BACT|nr:hypothetical protein [Frigoriglobus tundricola]QJW98651.1 hypothetical protein FTUN_6246 [Frigoriglobus tundricola]